MCKPRVHDVCHQTASSYCIPRHQDSRWAQLGRRLPAVLSIPPCVPGRLPGLCSSGLVPVAHCSGHCSSAHRKWEPGPDRPLEGGFGCLCPLRLQVDVRTGFSKLQKDIAGVVRGGLDSSPVWGVWTPRCGSCLCLPSHLLCCAVSVAHILPHGCLGLHTHTGIILRLASLCHAGANHRATLAPAGCL